MEAPGFGEPYTALVQRLALTLDSRPARPAPGTGARLEIHGESAFDVRNGRRWTKVGGALGAALDLNGHQRTLKVQVAADLVDPIGGGTVPFTELASLGGDDTMRGFVTGWMRGRSVATAELAYAWPVWFCVDGTARLAVGNAFGAQLDGFAPNKLRISGDVGVTTIGSRDHGFEILVGLGTETFEQGGHINSVRFTFGSRRGI
jgi:outer membrane protein assembly factor BamA